MTARLGAVIALVLLIVSVALVLIFVVAAPGQCQNGEDTAVCRAYEFSR